jgi:hypothetical protein
VSEIQEYIASSGQSSAPYSEALAFPRVGFRLHWRGAPIFIKRAHVCASCDGLHYQVNGGCAIMKYDTPRDNKVRAGTHHT